MEKEIKIFLASSFELELERVYAGDLFNDINSLLAYTNVRIRLLKWENFNPAFSSTRKQSEYEEQIKKADVFVALFRSKAGQFTIDETEAAKFAHSQNGIPKELYCFIQDYEGEREFIYEELKEKLGSDFIINTFSDLKDFKFKLIKILIPLMNACGVNITETDKFVQINQINFFRK